MIHYKICKVEFYHPSYWLYSVQKLFVFQQLVTLYLCGNHIKGSEWESVKKCSRLCKDAKTRGWLTTSKPPKLAHVWSMQGSWRVKLAVALQDKSLKLARPLVHGLNSWLSPVARPSRQTTLFGKNWLFTFLLILLYKTRLTHPQSSHRDSSNSSTLFLSFVKSLRGTLPNHFLTIPISVRRPFGV